VEANDGHNEGKSLVAFGQSTSILVIDVELFQTRKPHIQGKINYAKELT